MGQAFMAVLPHHPELQLLAALNRTHDLATELQKNSPDVVIDFTDASLGVRNTTLILEAGCRPVIGTSGFTKEDVLKLQNLAKQYRLGGVIAPNFSLGSLLVMKYAQEISRYFPNVEIVETHHERKKDAPSGTSLKTAELIAEVRGQTGAIPLSPSQSVDLIPGAEGARHHGIHIHSLRLPGHLAHQEVIFGGPGEVISLRHDVVDRACYMPGVCLACKMVMEMDYLAYGLEHLLFNN